jgi:mRNA interferase YafQ
MTKVIEHKYRVVKSAEFKKGYKLAKKQGKDLTLLAFAIDQLSKDIPLPSNWKDHQLKGSLKNFRECHINGFGNWLLIYEKRDSELMLYLFGTGSHSDLFKSY